MKKEFILLLFISVSLNCLSQRHVSNGRTGPVTNQTPASGAVIGKGQDMNRISLVVTKDNFQRLHPCGIAVSKSGQIAVSTFEGNNAVGHVFIWKKFDDFNANKQPDYQYELLDPEGLVFDNDGVLFISSPSYNCIYYTSNIAVKPIHSFPINLATAHNTTPRALAVDRINNLYAMCVNNDATAPTTLKSAVIRISNPTRNDRGIVTMGGSTQSNKSACGVTVLADYLITTNYDGDSLTSFIINGSNLTRLGVLKQAGKPIDVAFDGIYAFFTNSNGYLVRWSWITHGTQKIMLGHSGLYYPWGVVCNGNNIIVADALYNKVRVISKFSTEWRD